MAFGLESDLQPPAPLNIQVKASILSFLLLESSPELETITGVYCRGCRAGGGGGGGESYKPFSLPKHMLHSNFCSFCLDVVQVLLKLSKLEI